jgi:hypothetical protein
MMGASRRLVYLANPARLSAVAAGETDPVGFPVEDVFRYDAATAARLLQGWAANGNLDQNLWTELEPFGSS